MRQFVDHDRHEEQEGGKDRRRPDHASRPGVIGVMKDEVIQRFLTQIPVKFESASQDARLNGVFIDVDSETGKARKIERILRS